MPSRFRTTGDIATEVAVAAAIPLAGAAIGSALEGAAGGASPAAGQIGTMVQSLCPVSCLSAAQRVTKWQGRYSLPAAMMLEV